MNKIRIYAVALAVMLSCSGAFAQTDAFYSEVKGFMADNPGAYDKIVASYFAGDELSLDDYTMLYYGYSLTKDYKPDYYNRSVDSLIKNLEYDKAYAVLKEDHKNDPTSLQTLFDLMGMAYVLEKSQEGQLYQKHYINLMLAIIQANGDGLSREGALRVNRVTDEFQILSTYFKASSIVSKELSDDNIDKVTIKDSEGNVKDVYFDFSRYMDAITGK